MMKSRVLILVAALLSALVSFSSCKKEEKTLDVKGEWELTEVKMATKSALVGAETVTVYLNLAEDGSFAMYQMVGDGRFVTFSGSWKLAGSTLSGTYADGTSWASSYEVSVEKSTLTMTTEDGLDVFVYKACTIPYDQLGVK
jgi:hypothetical protein